MGGPYGKCISAGAAAAGGGTHWAHVGAGHAAASRTASAARYCWGPHPGAGVVAAAVRASSAVTRAPLRAHEKCVPPAPTRRVRDAHTTALTASARARRACRTTPPATRRHPPPPTPPPPQGAAAGACPTPAQPRAVPPRGRRRRRTCAFRNAYRRARARARACADVLRGEERGAVQRAQRPRARRIQQRGKLARAAEHVEQVQVRLRVAPTVRAAASRRRRVAVADSRGARGAAVREYDLAFETGVARLERHGRVDVNH